MDQTATTALTPQQAKGLFVLRAKRYVRNNGPTVTATLSTPGEDRRFKSDGFSGVFYAKDDVEKKNPLQWHGGTTHAASLNDDAAAQFAAIAAGATASGKTFDWNGKEFRPGQWVIYQNAKKPKEEPLEKGLPFFYGRWHNGETLIEIGSWGFKNSENEPAYFIGNTQFPYKDRFPEMQSMSDDDMQRVQAMHSDVDFDHETGEIAEATGGRKGGRQADMGGR
jgi:hypothetical protein